MFGAVEPTGRFNPKFPFFGGVLTAGSAFDPDAKAFFDEASITDSTQRNAVNQLVVDLKAASLWTKMIAIYPFVGGTADTHKYNLKNPQDTDGAFRIVWVGTVTHNANGITPNGTTGYGDTKLTGASLTIDNTHLSVYCRTIGTDQTRCEIGAQHNVNASSLVLRVRNNGFFDSIAYSTQVGDSTVSVASTDGRGFFIGTRTSSTVLRIFKNGVTSATQTATRSGSLPTIPLYVGARNFNSGINDPSNRNLAFVSVGSGLSDADAANFNTAVQAYQTALGRQV